jgi:hypothetical protein
LCGACGKEANEKPYQALTTGYDMTLIYGGNLLLVFISGLSGQLPIYIYFGNNF